MMTKEQVQDYRVNAYPPEIDTLRGRSIELAGLLDSGHCDVADYKMSLEAIIERAEFYYKKRKRDFGVGHMKLMRLIFETREILKDVG